MIIISSSTVLCLIPSFFLLIQLTLHTVIIIIILLSSSRPLSLPSTSPSNKPSLFSLPRKKPHQALHHQGPLQRCRGSAILFIYTVTIICKFFAKYNKSTVIRVYLPNCKVSCSCLYTCVNRLPEMRLWRVYKRLRGFRCCDNQYTQYTLPPTVQLPVQSLA